jgi:hypothetical protein
MIILQNAYVKLEYDQVKKRLTQEWKGFVPSKDFREAIDATVKFAEKNPVKTIMSDTLNQGVVKPEDTEYAGAAMPKLVGKGLKAMAFVIPENIFTQLSLKKFADNEQTKSVQYFKSVSDASKWLDQA